MKSKKFSRVTVAGSVVIVATALAMDFVLLAGLPLQQAYAAPTTTLTGQSIMVNLQAAGTFTVVENQIWKYDLEAAAFLFSNTQQDGAPTESCSSTTSGPTSTFETAPQPVTGPCDPTVIPPQAPAPDGTKLLNNLHPGGEDVVGKNQCNFLDGAALTGLSYTQSAPTSAQCTYVSASDTTPITNGPNAGKYKVTRKTVTKTCTDTWTYNITPQEESYPPLTAWFLYDTTSGGNAEVNVDGIIAGQSVISSKQYAHKYSFSIGGDTDPRVSRVVNLVVTVDSVTYSVGSTIVKNLSNVSPTLTASSGDIVFGPNGELDFYYEGNAGSNGHTELLNQPGDARTILNTDSFPGNNNGGADGSALAVAVMDTVPLSLAPGDHPVTLTGTVKDNTASLNDITFTVTQIVHIITPGCHQ